jgi:ribonucleoside-diphosphate reductase alpha chain
MWEEVVTLGKKFGFRNAQTTCAAPTGTISFMMDCDTTGIEPEFALVKEKMYSGGGADKIVNQSVEPALVGLGYTSDQVRDIITHINGSGQIKKIGEVGVCEKRLISLGFDEETLSKVNKKVKSSRTLGDAFSNIPEAVAIVQEVQDRFDIDAENGVDPLERMGFSSDEIDAANLYSCGHMGIETAPHLRAEHIPIFDCAAMCGIDGTRLIHPQGHIKMMAAIQPFLSAGISKTVNLPFDATSQDIWDIFVSAWQQGLKCITIYRDGCKGSQPLTASGRAGEEDTSPLVIRRRKPPTLMTTGKRRKLTMNGYTIYVHAYHDEDTGKINEIWIDTKPGGGILDGFLNAIAKLVSTALQYGIPMEEIIQKFAYSSFDPSGNVTHPKIKKCKSLLDLVFRTIAVDFLGDDTYADNPEAEMMPSPQPVAQQEISGSRHHEIIICIQCGSDQVLKTGTCYTCPICGTTTGCA